MKCGRWFWMKSSWRGDIIVFSEKKKKKDVSSRWKRWRSSICIFATVQSRDVRCYGAVVSMKSSFQPGGSASVAVCFQSSRIWRRLLSYVQLLPPFLPPSTLLVHFPSHLCRVQYIKKIGRKTNVYYFTQTRPHFVKSRKCVVLKYLLDSLWLLFYSSTWEGTLFEA